MAHALGLAVGQLIQSTDRVPTQVNATLCNYVNVSERNRREEKSNSIIKKDRQLLIKLVCILRALKD
jgi:hypothetical protein